MVTQVSKCDFRSIVEGQAVYLPTKKLSVEIFFREMSELFGSKWKQAYNATPTPDSALYQFVSEKLVLPVGGTPESKRAAANFLRKAIIAYYADCHGWPDIASAVRFINQFSPFGNFNVDAAFNEAQRLSHSCETAAKWSHVAVREAARMTSHRTLSQSDQKSAKREFTSNYRTAVERYKRGELKDANYDAPALPTLRRVSTTKSEAKAHIKKLRLVLLGGAQNDKKAQKEK